MKKFLALSFALALTFSTTVCAETIVPTSDFYRLGELSTDAEKALPEYTSDAVAVMDGINDIAPIASGSDMITEGKATNATCTVNKADVTAVRYAQKQAAQVGGTVVDVVELTAPGVNLENAQVALRVEGVKAGDAVSAYKCVKGDWIAVPVLAVADDSVTIAYDFQGVYTLIK